MKTQDIVGDRPLKDPVCGMSVRAESPHRYRHEGTEFLFCCQGCLEKFKSDPERYLSANAHSHRDVGGQAGNAIYTCPMHPEIRQQGPGMCPKCGMALEPEIVTAEEAANPELEDMTRRFWIATILSVPVLVLGMMETARWIQFGLATPVVIW